MAEARLDAGRPRLHGAAALRNGALVALVLLLLFNAFFTRDFLTLQTLNVNLSQVAQVVVVAMGMALVVATGGIDLSVGATAAFAGTLAAVMLSQTQGLLAQPGLALAAALTLPLVAAAGFGAVNGTLIARFGIQPIVATLVLFIAGRGFAEMLTESNLRTFSGSLDWLRANLLGVPVQGWLMLVVVAVTAWVMRQTVFSRWVLAVGGNERAARLAGIPARRVKLWVYVVCGVLAGVAGIMNVAMISAADPARIGQNIELDAIAAVAVGGTRLTGGRANIIGTLVGAVLIQLLHYTLLAHGVADEWGLLVKAGIILLAVWLQRKEA
ncbi:ABC transporter permease [Ramlibacter tataouinensis]|uniref:Candidate Ribose/xylose/arabinose/galactoside ABC type transport systems, permease component n=1 Tax=Ramlibacter tataouinensis (strain ATCC BAA-407 / DSM 14655 / LMG 21543 / TTB310) TaxID=365046 RepID=F5XVU4_RAMTT|nr:ABC transporter permease [Ramlibacter tataouinensis]AEG92857.1 candidate Ribose/xylose/arabinose/galactoside ABC type transport systems, permease component [Ramlibacter tataouinensis TTB310]